MIEIEKASFTKEIVQPRPLLFSLQPKVLHSVQLCAHPPDSSSRRNSSKTEVLPFGRNKKKKKQK